MHKIMSAVVVGFCASIANPALSQGKTGNVAHDRLSALPPSQQAAMLGRVVGEGCQGRDAFFMGLNTLAPGKSQVFWSVRCTNGKGYQVSIEPDSNGSTRVLECSVLKAFAKVECFKTFEAQR